MKAAGCGAQAGREASNRPAETHVPAESLGQGSGPVVDSEIQQAFRSVVCVSGWLKRVRASTHRLPEQQGHRNMPLLPG